MLRSDCHVHLDRIGPPHRTDPPTLDEFKAYVAREGITLVCAIYERSETLEAFSETSGVELVPFYWERRPASPSVPSNAAGVKLHPYIEKYSLTASNVGKVLRVAAARGLIARTAFT